MQSENIQIRENISTVDRNGDVGREKPTFPPYPNKTEKCFVLNRVLVQWCA